MENIAGAVVNLEVREGGVLLMTGPWREPLEVKHHGEILAAEAKRTEPLLDILEGRIGGGRAGRGEDQDDQRNQTASAHSFDQCSRDEFVVEWYLGLAKDDEPNPPGSSRDLGDRGR